MQMVPLAASFAVLGVALLGGPAVYADTAVDLELVLAIDASASVDPAEFSLQVGGIANALRDAEIQEAISSGPVRPIAVTSLLLPAVGSAGPGSSTGGC